MSKHTPGPWAVHPVRARVDAFNSGDALPVCELLWPTDERTEEETEANAALIAAAPDLLEALQRLRNEAKLTGLDQQAGWDAWFAMADEALAKAEPSHDE
jgi:hypothetical protein